MNKRTPPLRHPSKVERIPDAVQAELPVALGRILAWLIDNSDVGNFRHERIGMRTLILAYKLRPDLIGGATLHEIAARVGHGRSSAGNTARQFTRIFGVRSVNDKASPVASAHYRAAWRRSHPGKEISHPKLKCGYLISLFVEWHTLMKEVDALPKTRDAAQRMRREFEPLMQFIKRLDDARTQGGMHAT